MCVNVFVLARRERWTCWLCGLRVYGPDDGVDKGSALGPSRDHVRPASLGGSSRSHNLRLAHRHCNSNRERRPKEQLAAEIRSLVSAMNIKESPNAR